MEPLRSRNSMAAGPGLPLEAPGRMETLVPGTGKAPSVQGKGLGLLGVWGLGV